MFFETLPILRFLHSLLFLKDCIRGFMRTITFLRYMSSSNEHPGSNHMIVSNFDSGHDSCIYSDSHSFTDEWTPIYFFRNLDLLLRY